MKRIAFNTLGCRLNQYETDALASSFRDAGYEIARWNESADAYVINTCTVTDRSDRKSRALIYQALRAAQKNTGISPVVVVTGCFVENEENEIVSDPRITYVVDNDRKASIFSIVDSHLHGRSVDVNSLAADRFAFRDSVKGFHTRSSVKIQDGCDNRCTFCIIPHVRGRAVSRPFDRVLKQVFESIQAGAKEIVITGVNIGRYRSENMGFADLLKEVLDIDGDFRVRVSSIEPETGSARRTKSWESGFIALLDHPKLCPHLHLCLQSGSDAVLKSMGRRYTTTDVIETVNAIREKRPDFNLTTDVIVGFPGESDGDFSKTLEVIREINFSHVHTFPFSLRPGTPASRMPGQISHEAKVRRAREVRNLSDVQKRLYREGLIGKKQTVLIESAEHGAASGYSEYYVPIEISTNEKVNTFVPVKPVSLGQGKDPALLGITIPSCRDDLRE